MREHQTIEQRLSDYLAHRIFAAPHGVGSDRAQRLAFKGGEYPDHETDLGGLDIHSLTVVIREALRGYKW